MVFGIVSCSQPENSSIENKPDFRFHFSCTPIGWSRDDVEDRAPSEYFNELFYPSHSLGEPPLWLRKEAVTIDFEDQFFDGKESVADYGGNSVETKIYFNEKTIRNSHKICADFTKSPKGSCTTNDKVFNRITRQLAKTDIDAAELEGEKALYQCSQVTSLGETWEDHRDSFADNTPEDLSENADN